MKSVYLDIGHGGDDPGAVANGLRESDVNLQIGLEARRHIVRHGVACHISRTKDENDPLSESIREANAYKPDVAVSIHNNSGGGKGFEVFVQTGTYREKSRDVAGRVELEMQAIGQTTRGIKTKLNSSKTDYFGFLRQLTVPAILVECAFLDNAADAAKVDELHEQQAFGGAIAKGVLKALGIAWVPEVTTPVAPPAAPAWQTDGLAALVKAGIITQPEEWQHRLGASITVGEVIGILGKMIAKT